jgi:hypothetical protein
MRETRNSHIILIGGYEVKRLLEGPREDRRIILKWILDKKQGCGLD